MPGHERKSQPESGPEISRADMLAIRDELKQKLIHDYYSYRMTARLYRKLGKLTLAQAEEDHMKDTQRMIADLTEEEDDESIKRLLEGAQE